MVLRGIDGSPRTGRTRHKCEPGIFHIHVDATKLPALFESYCVEGLGMQPTNFSGHPAGYAHFEPSDHLTLKLRDARSFRTAWNNLQLHAAGVGFVGYLEAEYIALDEEIPEAPWTKAPVPFTISRRRLNSARGERFRESELHLSVDRDRSDPGLVRGLLDSGLYGAYLPKANRVDLVLTAQGKRETVGLAIDALRQYLQAAGGAAGASLKEERVVGFALYGVRPEELPEVMDDFRFGQ